MKFAKADLQFKRLKPRILKVQGSGFPSFLTHIDEFFYQERRPPVFFFNVFFRPRLVKSHLSPFAALRFFSFERTSSFVHAFRLKQPRPVTK